MKTVILCGGLGTRLREETEYRPKPMVEVGGYPILWHIMKHYAHYGHKEFVLCLGYKGDLIKEYFLNYRAMNNDFTVTLGKENSVCYHGCQDEDFRVTLIDTGEDTMTGGRVKRISKYVNNETFMLTYGDGLADVDIACLLKFHKSHGKIATITTFRPASRFGILDINETAGQIVSFREKPSMEEWASAGFMVFNPELFDYISDDSTVLENEPLKKLVSENQVMAYKHDGSFYIMDTYREYLQLNAMWKQGATPWKVW